MPEPPSEAERPAAKRSFFKKPSWANTEAPKKIDSTDLFRLSDNTYSDIIAANARRRQEARSRKEKTVKKESIGADSGQRENKRRRVSDESLGSAAAAAAAAAAAKSPKEEPTVDENDQTPQFGCMTMRSAKDHAHQLGTSRKALPAENGLDKTDQAIIIDLESDSGSDPDQIPQTVQEAHVKNIVVQKPRYQDRESSPVSEDEFPELARLARERARRRRLELQGASATPETQQTRSSAELASQSPGGLPAAAAAAAARSELVVEIFISSDIPNTNPLIVHRKLSQRLQDVRVAWCRRQGFSEDMADTVFLTWKGKRLFDVTTCKHLGIAVDEDDEAMLADPERGRTRVHMEAMTEELFEESKKAKQNGGNRTTTASAQASGEQEEESPDEESRDKSIRILLKHPKEDDWKLIVKPTTKISRIISTYVKARKVAADADISLMFDGEKLDPDDVVGDTEIDDLDAIDVRIK